MPGRRAASKDVCAAASSVFHYVQLASLFLVFFLDISIASPPRPISYESTSFQTSAIQNYHQDGIDMDRAGAWLKSKAKDLKIKPREPPKPHAGRSSTWTQASGSAQNSTVAPDTGSGENKPSTPHPSSMINSTDDSPALHDPTPLDVLRYRYQHATNLGSIFDLERWLFGSMFPASATSNQTSELEAGKSWIRELGSVSAAREKFEAHWANALSDADLDWLVDTARVTAIRLPIGFFTLGPQFCTGTAFADVAGIYENAWRAVKVLVQKINRRGIGVLFDMHALPGGANTGDHSGTNSGKAELWGNATNLALAKQALEALVWEAAKMEGVIGVQVVNEAAWEAQGLYDWYDSLLAGFSRIDPNIPIYISDAWNLGTAVKYALKQNKLTAGSNPVVVDTHLYWAFSDDDKKKSPQQVISEASGKLAELVDGGSDRITSRGGAVGGIVGEYSCVLSEDSWALAGGASREQLVLQFGHTQTANHQARSGGSFFWTFKMDWMPGGEWGFKQQTDNGSIIAPSYLKMTFGQVQDSYKTAVAGEEAAKKAAVDSHINYWNLQSPGQAFEHWRYEEGWKLGFRDSTTFFGMRATGRLGNCGGGADKIGQLDLWIRKRIADGRMTGGFVWEFEQGFRKGVEDFGKLSGAY